MISFPDFEAQARAEGCDEVAARTRPPGRVPGTHARPFAVTALVVQGQRRLTCGDDAGHLRPGDTFELARAARHAQRSGDEEATCRVARRH